MKTNYQFLFCGLFIVSMLNLKGQSNEGVNFWFGFMEHFDVGENNMVAMITAKSNTGGTIKYQAGTGNKHLRYRLMT